jgi:hypothetical protein
MVRKITGVMTILTSLMKASPSGLSAAPVWGAIAQRHAQRDRDQHLKIEIAIPAARPGAMAGDGAALIARMAGPFILGTKRSDAVTKDCGALAPWREDAGLGIINT